LTPKIISTNGHKTRLHGFSTITTIFRNILKGARHKYGRIKHTNRLLRTLKKFFKNIKKVPTYFESPGPEIDLNLQKKYQVLAR
jgi:hypothetical protein